MKFTALYVLPFVLVPVMVSFSSCASDDDNVPVTARVVEAAAAVSREINTEIRGFGSLTYLKKNDIAAPLDAVIDRLYFREGDFVEEGDIVAALVNPQIPLAVRRAESGFSHAEAALDLARARLDEGIFHTEARILENEKAEAELEQARRTLSEQRRKHESEEILYLAGGLSDEAIRDSRFKLESAEVQFRLMEKELEIKKVGLRESDLETAGFDLPRDKAALRGELINMATAGLRAEAKAAEANLESAMRELESSLLLESSLVIKSPITGTVGSRYFEEGERIRAEEKIFTLMDTRSLYSMFTVPETDALKLLKGMPATVSIDGTGGIYDGKIDLVSPHADSQSFTFLVRVILDSVDEGKLKPGMFSRITVSLDRSQNIILIPEGSLSEKKDNFGKVFTIRGSVLSERIVKLGQLYGEEREIVSGLSVGEVVVLRPDSALQDGTYVSVAR